MEEVVGFLEEVVGVVVTLQPVHQETGVAEGMD
jgi:hypothetical protein